MDSLFNVWNNESLADTNRLEAMTEICRSLARNYPDSTLTLTGIMLEFAEEKGLKKFQANALLHLGRAFSYKADFDETAEAYQRSLELYEEVGYQLGIGRVKAYIAGLHDYNGDYPLSIEYARQVLDIADALSSPMLSSGVLMVLGHSYSMLGAYVKALEAHERGLKDAEMVNDKVTMGYHLLAIAELYRIQGEDAKAREYAGEAMSSYQEANDLNGTADVLAFQGTRHSDNGEYQLALEVFMQCLPLYEQISGESNPGVIITLHQIGMVHFRQGDYQLAIEYFDRAITHLELNRYQDYYAKALTDKGNVFLELGNYAEAISWCIRGLNVAQENNEILNQARACNCLYTAHKALRQGNAALAYHEKYLVLEDSLNASETAKKLQQMEFAKQMLADSLAQEEEELRLEMAYLEQIGKEKSQRNTFMFGGIAFLLLAGGLWSRLRYTRKAKKAIEKEKDRSENLLLNILPAEVAEELKATGKAVARDFEMVSIIFTDFKAFTETSEQLTAAELVDELNYCFEGFDRIMEKYGIEKIKTIGDAYMAAGGLPVSTEDSTRNTVKAALDMQAFVKQRKAEQDAKGLMSFEMRAGVHTGPVVAGIVGAKKFQYDIWGDTVNTASRMESNSEVGHVNVSHDTYEQIKDDTEFTFEQRGKVEVKGKGELEMYFVSVN